MYIESHIMLEFTFSILSHKTKSNKYLNFNTCKFWQRWAKRIESKALNTFLKININSLNFPRSINYDLFNKINQQIRFFCQTKLFKNNFLKTKFRK